jgi:hypothetical protein
MFYLPTSNVMYTGMYVHMILCNVCTWACVNLSLQAKDTFACKCANKLLILPLIFW